MNRVARILVLALSAGGAAGPRPARACGGCFAPPETVTAVESHRMVISLSVDRTTLWDQIVYSGDPADFVWVLPVPTGAATIELADPLFFDELDERTAPRISPPVQAVPGSAGADCSGPSGGADNAPPAPDGVTVYREQTVGPYESATLGSDDTGALYAWLTAHGYNVPAATLPTIDYYVDQGSEFIVLRLAPGEDVQAMEPVRVRYPGYMASFPLKMVSVGAAGTVSLSLWVIAEQRYEAGNYATVRVDERDLRWDFATNTSNYGAVFEGVIDGAGGRAWVVEYAAPLVDIVPLSAADDVEVATVGLPYPYLTRLRTRMPVEYLDEDLALRPSDDASDVSNLLTAQDPSGRSAEPPAACAVSLPRRARTTATAVGLGVMVILLLRRQRRR